MFEEMNGYLDELQRAMDAIHGTLGTVKVDNVNDPGAVERGIREMERIIDEKLSPFMDNPTVRETAQAMKDTYRRQMLDAVEKKKSESAASA